jgi:hypothetical protein
MVKICTDLQQELSLEERALDVLQERNRLVTALAQTKTQQSKAWRYLMRLEINIEEAREDMSQTLCLPHPEYVQVPSHQAEPYLLKAQNRARQAADAVQQAMCNLAGIVSIYPEVSLYLRVGLPHDLTGLWRGYRSRETFQCFETVCKSRRCIYKIVDGGETFAAKQYHIGSEQGTVELGTFFREAAMLKRMKHPHIIEIQGIVQEVGPDTCYYIFMPFCKHGSLLQWVTTAKPTDLSLRRVLLGVVQALIHIHAHDVAHGDCKPDNILINNDGRALLANFDIASDGLSRLKPDNILINNDDRALPANFDIASDGLSRITSGHQQQRTWVARRVAFTQSFNAPELFAQGASKPTDMFAFGRTVAAAYDKLAEDSVEDVKCFVEHLTRQDPALRFSAEGAFASKYFAPIFMWQRDERRRCTISLEEHLLEDGLQCGGSSERHFVSSGSLDDYVLSELSAELGRRRQLEGKIVCPVPGCGANYCDADLAKTLSCDTFASYVKSRIELVEYRLSIEKELEVQNRIETELARIKHLDERIRKVQDCARVVEEHLVLKCPDCSHAFLDFDGCWALRCSQCRCGFCGWCLRSCGQDAHAHIREGCPEVPPGVRNPLFPTQAGLFHEHHCNRRGRLVKSYLETLDDDTRRGVLLEVRAQLKDMVPQPVVDELMRQCGLIWN